MELFQLSISVLTETCKGMEQDIEAYTCLTEKVKYCCAHLASQGWRGNSRNQFVRNYEVWYANSTAFINDLTTLHKIMCENLERAEDLNQEALYLPRLSEEEQRFLSERLGAALPITLITSITSRGFSLNAPGGASINELTPCCPTVMVYIYTTKMDVY